MVLARKFPKRLKTGLSISSSEVHELAQIFNMLKKFSATNLPCSVYFIGNGHSAAAAQLWQSKAANGWI